MKGSSSMKSLCIWTWPAADLGSGEDGAAEKDDWLPGSAERGLFQVLIICCGWAVNCSTDPRANIPLFWRHCRIITSWIKPSGGMKGKLKLITIHGSHSLASDFIFFFWYFHLHTHKNGDKSKIEANPGYTAGKCEASWASFALLPSTKFFYVNCFLPVPQT